MNQDHPNYTDVLKVGDQARNFSLADTDGTIVTLSAVLRRGPVLIIFYRGDW